MKFGNLPTLFARLDARPMERNGRTIGVISFNVWMTAISRSLDEAIDRFRSSKGIVLDLRGNPGGVLTMIMGISGYFLDAPVNLGVIKSRDSSLNLVANPRLVGFDGQSVTPFGGPLAILVDSGSYSASEIFTGGMQSIKRARVFGTRTAGGALPAVLEQLPGGDRPRRRADATRSLLTLRKDIADVLVERLEEAEASAATLPHRSKYLLTVSTPFLRRYVELHRELVDEVERELWPRSRRGGKQPGLSPRR